MQQNESKKWKRGDTNPETGMIAATVRKDYKGGVWWVTPEKFAQLKETIRLRKKAKYDAIPPEVRSQKRKEQLRKRRERDPDAFKKMNRDRYEKYGEKIRARSRDWSKNNRDKVKERTKKRTTEQRERDIQRSKKWAEKNRERKRQSDREYREKNKEKCAARAKKYRQEKRHILREKSRERLKNNPVVALAYRYRSTLMASLKRKGFTKKSKSAEILGCDWETFKVHLESYFQPGMTWENMGRGGWHIDHHIPIAMAKTEEDALRLNHYTNLRPLWWLDNIRKKDKHPDEFYGTK